MTVEYDDADMARSFEELQIDSIGWIELRSRVEQLTGVPIPDAAIETYANAEGLARYVLEQLGLPAPLPSIGAGALLLSSCRPLPSADRALGAHRSMSIQMRVQLCGSRTPSSRIRASDSSTRAWPFAPPSSRPRLRSA